MRLTTSATSCGPDDVSQGTGLASIYHLPDLQQLNLPKEIIELFNAFPFGMRDRPHNKSYFLPFVPTRGRALQLLEHYYQSFAWMLVAPPHLPSRRITADAIPQ